MESETVEINDHELQTTEWGAFECVNCEKVTSDLADFKNQPCFCRGVNDSNSISL